MEKDATKWSPRVESALQAVQYAQQSLEAIAGVVPLRPGDDDVNVQSLSAAKKRASAALERLARTRADHHIQQCVDGRDSLVAAAEDAARLIEHLGGSGKYLREAISKATGVPAATAQRRGDELNLDPAYPLDEIVTLDADKLAVVLRTLQEQVRDLQMLHSIIKDSASPVQRETVRNALYMNEHRLVQLCKLTDVQLETAAEVERRYADIRRANERARELERQLGQGGSPEQTAANLKVLAESLRQWWRGDGFGHVSELSFTDYGHVRAKLSCSLFGGFRLVDSPTPVSDAGNKKAWQQSLEMRGFVLHTDPSEREPELVDCDATRAALVATIGTALPSAKIIQTENYHARSGHMKLRSVEIIVYELADLTDLKATSGWEAEEA